MHLYYGGGEARSSAASLQPRVCPERESASRRRSQPAHPPRDTVPDPTPGNPGRRQKPTPEGLAAALGLRTVAGLARFILSPSPRCSSPPRCHPRRRPAPIRRPLARSFIHSRPGRPGLGPAGEGAAAPQGGATRGPRGPRLGSAGEGSVPPAAAARPTHHPPSEPPRRPSHGRPGTGSHPCHPRHHDFQNNRKQNSTGWAGGACAVLAAPSGGGRPAEPRCRRPEWHVPSAGEGDAVQGGGRGDSEPEVLHLQGPALPFGCQRPGFWDARVGSKREPRAANGHVCSGDPSLSFPACTVGLCCLSQAF